MSDSAQDELEVNEDGEYHEEDCLKFFDWLEILEEV